MELNSPCQRVHDHYCWVGSQCKGWPIPCSRCTIELLAYTKSSDEQFVDYIHIKYKLKCHLTPSFGISQVDRHMNRNLIKGFRNLLLHKALSVFKKESIIDFISYSDTNDGKEKDTFQLKNDEN